MTGSQFRYEILTRIAKFSKIFNKNWTRGPNFMVADFYMTSGPGQSLETGFIITIVQDIIYSLSL